MSKYDSYSKHINYDEIRYLLEHMNHQHLLYMLIKSELEKRGNWKPAARGQGFKPGDDPRRNDFKEFYKNKKLE